MSLNKEKKYDLQIMQNNVLRICNNTKLSDRVSIEKLHKKAKLLSLEQRRQKQLLTLMYIYSQLDDVQHVGVRHTRMANKFVFKTANRIGNKYENSTFHRGTKLWNNLTRDVQWIFKSNIAKLYKVYNSRVQ